MKWIALLLSAPLAGCASLRWDRITQECPVTPSLLASVALDRDDVQTCLAKLGAPTHVWPAAGGDVVLAYGWARVREWGFRISTAIKGTSVPLFDMNSLGTNTVGYALWFDSKWILRDVRFGHLEELAAGTRSKASALRFDLDDTATQP